MASSLERRLTLSFGVVVATFALFFVTSNMGLIGDFQESSFRQRLQELTDLGELDRCAAEPTQWSAPDRGHGGMHPIVDGRVVGPDAPHVEGPFPTPEHGEFVRFGGPTSKWAGVLHSGRDGPCELLLVHQFDWMGFESPEFWIVVAIRVAFVGVLLVAAWWFIVTPPTRRMAILAKGMGDVVDSDFRTDVDVPPEEELARLANAFNSATTAARERMEQLTERDAALRRVVANIAHDVRTPLASLQLSVGRLEREHPDLLADSNVLPELSYLEALIGNLTTMVKLEQASLPLMRADVDLGDLVERVAARHRPVSRSKSVELHAGVPDEPPIFKGDPLALEQALSNLTQNAVDFAQGNVAIRCTRDGGTVLLEVLDDGPGVTRAEIPRLSQRSYQGHSSRTRRRAGQGLGLAIAAEVAERHGGELVLERLDEGGTRAALVLVDPDPAP